jgi:hypothetical protein
MKLEVVIKCSKSNVLVEESKLANQMMQCYFGLHKIQASDAFIAYEGMDFENELSEHWITATDLAAVACFKGIDNIPGDYEIVIKD